VVNDSADVTSSGRSFQVCGPVTGKARLPTVDSLLVGTEPTRRLVLTETTLLELFLDAWALFWLSLIDYLTKCTKLSAVM